MQIWKIGTKVKNYLDESKEIFTKLKYDKFIVKKISDESFIFESREDFLKNYKYNKSLTTVSQLLSSLLGLGIISLEDPNQYLRKREDFFEEETIYFFNPKMVERGNLNEIIVSYFLSNPFLEKLSDVVENKKNKRFNATEEELLNPFNFENEELFLNSFFLLTLDRMENFTSKMLANLFVVNDKNMNTVKDYYEGVLTSNFFNQPDLEYLKLKKIIIEYFFIDEKRYQDLIADFPNANINVKRNENDPFKKQNLNLENKINSKNNEFIKANIESFGSLLKICLNKTIEFKIPIYQRSYKWTKEIIDKLFNDIKDLDTKTPDQNYHFLGNLVVNNPNKLNNQLGEKQIWKIVDGQQRFTSLLIILKSLFDSLKSRDTEPDPFLLKLFDLNENEENEIISSFQHLPSNENFSDFRNLMLGKHKEIIVENSLIYKNYEYLVNKFKELDDTEIKNYTLNLVTNVYFTLTRDTTNNEFEMFENMNTNKVELETIELIKNIIMMHVKEEILDAKEEIFAREFNEKILDQFKERNQLNKSKIDNFIATYVKWYTNDLGNNEKEKKLKVEISRADNNKDELYALFKKILILQINSKTNGKNKLNQYQYNEIIKEISENIILFLEMTDSSRYFETSSFLYNIGDILFIFEKRKIYNPILMTLIKKYLNNEREITNLNELRNLLFVLENYEIRFQSVLYRGQSMSKLMEKVLAKIIELDSNLTKDKLEEIFKNEIIFNRLSWPSNALFKQHLLMPMKADKLVTKLLFRMEFYLENGMSLSINKNHQYRNFKMPSREHIMPQDISKWRNELRDLNPDSSAEYIKMEHIDTLDLLGNSLILNKNLNSEAKNFPWLSKKDKYSKESNMINTNQYKGFTYKTSDSNEIILMSLKSKESWNFSDIKTRTSQMTDILLKIYR